VKNLTVGEQQIVEITKALAMKAHILIMDEPSAVLPSADLDRLFTVIGRYATKVMNNLYFTSFK